MKYRKIINGRKTPMIKGAAAIKISDIKQCCRRDCREKAEYIIYTTERYAAGAIPELKQDHMFSCGKHLNKALEGIEGGRNFYQLSLFGLEMLCVEDE